MNERKEKVIFEKPHIRALRQAYTLVDMHAHSRFSDGINNVSAIARRAKRLGIGIAMTDHNCIEGAVELDKHKDILSIPGIEVSTKEGPHLLVYFYKIKDLKEFYRRFIRPALGNDLMSPIALGIFDIARFAKGYECIVALAHPYVALVGACSNSSVKEKLGEFLGFVDAIEVINCESLHKMNLKSSLFAFNHSKSMVAGSDCHTLYSLGKALTIAPGRLGRREFLKAILAGETKACGKEIDILRKVTVNSFKLRKTLKNYPEVVERYIKTSCKAMNNKISRIGKKVMNRMGR